MAKIGQNWPKMAKNPRFGKKYQNFLKLAKKL
jgi:hypothetical protein